MEARSLPSFFEGLTRQVWADLSLDDLPAARYVTDLLTRFARTDALRAVALAPGRSLETVVDSLLEIQASWDYTSPTFDPGRERHLRRQIGDYTLFMTGIFRDHVERFAMTRYYQDAGRRAYRFAWEIARAGGEVEAPLFRRLSDRFEDFAGALGYMQKVYFGHDHPFQHFAAG